MNDDKWHLLPATKLSILQSRKVIVYASGQLIRPIVVVAHLENTILRFV
jgi:hypothetical protein